MSSTSNRRAVPLAVGMRTRSGQRYTFTTAPTMRRVAERATVALVGIVLTIGGLSVATSGPTIADRCADIAAGTDVPIPADVADICDSAR